MISRKTLKKIDLENFRSESFSIRTSEGRAPASKMVYRGVGADSEKPKKYFRLIMKKIYLENFKPLYTNKKVQLQLDFFDLSSCSWTF